MHSFHFIGIGGIGMSGLARLLLQSKQQVSGSDLRDGPIVEKLRVLGASVAIGHSESALQGAPSVVFNTDIPEENPELVLARKKQLTLLHRSDLLAQIMRGKKSLLVTGSHGKTTTSSLLTWVFEQANADPSFVVGGWLPWCESNAGAGSGEYFIAEADESDGTFLKYSGHAAIVTNIDSDHLSHFGSMEKLTAAFKQFCDQIPAGGLYYCKDDAVLGRQTWESLSRGVSYGRQASCQLRLLDLQAKGWKQSLTISYKGKTYQSVELALLGRHNALNALAVFGMALDAGLPEAAIRVALATFPGVARRCELKGQAQDVLIFDDYGHHPTEIQATIRGLRAATLPRRLVVIHQPHRYTRTASVLDLYPSVFEEADEVVLTDLYSAQEKPIAGISTQAVLEKLQAKDTVPLTYVPKNDLLSWAHEHLRPLDVVLCIGAGDITQVAADLAASLQAVTLKKTKVALVKGGASVEHAVSLSSARGVEGMLSPEHFEVSTCTISKSGKWGAAAGKLNIDVATLAFLSGVDCCLPVLHGPRGEDGMLASFLETCGLPCAASSAEGASICMNKDLTKRMAQSVGLNVLPWVSVKTHEWKAHADAILESVSESLTYPVYVKPCHQGSALGVSRVERPEDLAATLTAVFLIDDHVIVEQGIKAREIEFCCLGAEGSVRCPPPGEIPMGGALYTYEQKYGQNAVKAINRATLSPEEVAIGCALACKVYSAVGCDVLCRVDFFYDGQTFYLNEMNPFPGFTPTSLYPKNWEEAGLSAQGLLDEMVGWGLRNFRRRARLTV